MRDREKRSYFIINTMFIAEWVALAFNVESRSTWVLDIRSLDGGKRAFGSLLGNRVYLPGPKTSYGLEKVAV